MPDCPYDTARECLQNPGLFTVVFARQANIAHGPQQINNSIPREENKTAQNGVIEMDVGTPGAAGRSYKPLETVHRAAPP